MLKQREWHRKQNILSRGVASVTWLYIYGTRTFPSSILLLDQKLVTRTIIQQDSSKTLENVFFIDIKLQSKIEMTFC